VLVAKNIVGPVFDGVAYRVCTQDTINCVHCIPLASICCDAMSSERKLTVSWEESVWCGEYKSLESGQGRQQHVTGLIRR